MKSEGQKIMTLKILDLPRIISALTNWLLFPHLDLLSNTYNIASMSSNLRQQLGSALLVLVLILLGLIATGTVLLLPAFLLSATYSLELILESHSKKIPLFSRCLSFVLNKTLPQNRHLFFASLGILSFIITIFITMFFGYFYGIWILWYLMEEYSQYARFLSGASLLIVSVFGFIVNWLILRRLSK